MEASPETAAFAEQQDVQKIYDYVGKELLVGNISPGDYSYEFAWPLYDYLNYWNTHYANVSSKLAEPEFYDHTTHSSYLDMMRWYSDRQLNSWLGLSPVNSNCGRSMANITLT